MSINMPLEIEMPVPVPKVASASFDFSGGMEMDPFRMTTSINLSVSVGDYIHVINVAKINLTIIFKNA
jgi:hypothetical protein